MQPLEVEPQSKLVEKKVINTKPEVGVETQVVVQNESTKIVAEQLEAHDVQWLHFIFLLFYKGFGDRI